MGASYFCSSECEMTTPLSGKRIAVAGFNARPLACSLKRAGAKVYVSDYWGDADLSSCCEEWVSVLDSLPGQRQRTPLEQPVHLSLAQNLVQNFDCSTMDHIIIGSSFDDHPESLRLIEQVQDLTGNSSDLFVQARDSNRVVPLAQDLGFLTPQRQVVTSLEEALDAAHKIGYPCVVRPLVSGGGAGIRLAREPKEIENLVASSLGSQGHWRRTVQQYIRGTDISCSVMGTGSDAVTLSVQGQLIGLPSAGRNCDFVYCGNWIPVSLRQDVVERLRRICAQMCQGLGLVGSNGIDVVVDSDGAIWFMEVNPRIQGTIELLEESTNVSVSHMHIRACDGELPKEMPVFRPAVKMIVYSRKTGIVPDLSKWRGARDRTPDGVSVERGDPICTIVENQSSSGRCYDLVRARAAAIQSSVL
ncbi:ATP-grasp domain-containing protein [Candidatus Thorarchaeota archaeon]|nr:MAG: ATP-grasp domain-containing protein [Candidatus Thorarchaeota archaeon]